MRRIRMAVLALIAATTTVTAATAAAQAATSTTAATQHVQQVNSAVTSQTYRFRINLPPTQCSALRRSVHDISASCSPPTLLHVTRVSGSNASVYDIGWLEACAQTINSYGECNPNVWWVRDNFGFTYDGSHVWNNVHTCYANHTAWTWCGDTGNGTTRLVEGFNYGGPSGTSDYARITIDQDGGLFPPTGNLTFNDVGCDGTWDASCSPPAEIEYPA